MPTTMVASHNSTLDRVTNPSPAQNQHLNGVNGFADDYHYPRHVLNKPRPVRVVVIGAGVAGIAAVKLYKDRFKGSDVQLTIYEKNADVGGTWLENRYPGCACDVPAHAYNFSWEGNPNWSMAYVSSEEIFDYFKGRAKAYGVYDYLHTNHRVVRAEWQEEHGYWNLEIEDLENDRLFESQAEVVINSTGFLNNWKWPEIEGLDTFKGYLAHSARWDDSFDFTGKKVAVIGNGSSAIQIVPIIRQVADHLISFNRSPTWITPEFGADFAPDGRDTRFSEEQKKTWAEDRRSLLAYRKRVEGSMNNIFDVLVKDSQIQKDSFQQFQKNMRDKLGSKKFLAAKLVPDFAVGCRRVTPGHGYLEALASDNVTVESGSILKITPESIVIVDGTVHQVDAIICATGFDTSFRPAFPVIGDKGTDLRDDWEKEPRSYLSIAAAGYPNFFLTSGPNFPLANGTLIPCLERTVRYAFEAVAKIQNQGVKSLSPKPDAVEDFQEHKDSLMKDLAWSSGCRSWYKLGQVDGKVWGPWPGSAVHFLEAMDYPRWEDWNIKYTSKNRFAYFGNGKTSREESGGDLTWYLTEPGLTKE